MNDTHIKTRMPPSPTGKLHIGNARTMLFNYLYAQSKGGSCVLRFEDTDKERSKKEYEDNIFEAIQWLGITYEGPYKQSERLEVYTPYLSKLIESDKAYLSREDSKMNPGEYVEVIRLRNPGKSITFTDEIRGDITFDTAELGDIVIARDMKNPLYHFTVVVDDFEMGITHVIRGDDHIANTPRQILIQEALGFPLPIYVHLPLVLAPDKTKLSKRHGAVALTEYRDNGYLKEAIINYLALLGWNSKDEQEFFTVEELIQRFDISGFQKSGAVFDIEKLNWFNAHYLKLKSREENILSMKAFGLPEYFIDTMTKSATAYRDVLERITTMHDLAENEKKGEYSFYKDTPVFEPALLLKRESIPAQEAVEHLTWLEEKLSTLAENNFSAEDVKSAVWDYATEKGRGNVLWPLRTALSGKDKSPDPFTLSEAIGKSATLTRINVAIENLNTSTQS